MAEDWTVGKVVRWAADDFRARGITSPRLEAELLLSHVLGIDRIKVIVDAARSLSASELDRFRDAIRRRRTGEPVAYIRGEKEFYGRPFRVDHRVLVPRPDTEILVEVALGRTAHCSLGGRGLDLCTGSGCVAITIACERPTASLTAIDLSPDAIAVARSNALRLGAVHQIGWLSGDLYGPIAPGRPGFDFIVANPPYIPAGEHAGLAVDIKDFEPRMALLGGDDGLDVTRRIVAEAPAHLRAGGLLAIEVGSGQAAAVAVLFGEAGFSDVRIAKDYGGHDRVVSAARPSYGPP
jgi:release factor glutamine methyltransferase